MARAQDVVDSSGERGASLIEYGLLVALIAVVCVVAVQFFGGALSDDYSSNGSQLFGG